MTDSFCPTADRFRATNYRELCRRLAERYGLDEARAIVRLVLGERFRLSMADILCDKVTELSADDRTDLEKMMLRLLCGEPVQYVLGVADFCGRKFCVTPSVMIPRPETEELCRWVVEECGTENEEGGTRKEERGVRILDVGTGSGCIAVTLAAEMPEAVVTAWDISPEALKIARKNADSIGVNVNFEQVDILNLPFTIYNRQIASHSSLHTPHSTLLTPRSTLHAPRFWNTIVSNPPYVCEKEKTAMKPQVFEHEPNIALFVPDDDPLRFYRAIADYAQQSLKPGGRLYFEINPNFADEMADFLRKMAFGEVVLKDDSFGKKRFIKGEKLKS